jgi:short-subunit dehydrogenase
MTQGRALITGASAGLGAEFARQLAGRGNDLILVARRMELMEAQSKELADEFGVAVDTIQADLSEAGATSALYAEVTRRGHAVDYLINNAGSAGPDLVNDRDWPAQQQYIELMMTSVAGMCHRFIPPMRERGFGRVLNVASVAGLVTLEGDTSYGPAKAYLIALSKGLAATLRGKGIHVLALCPGFTHTDFHQSAELTRMKNRSPAFIWYDANVVVREGLEALEAGKDVYISGRLYRYLTPLLRSRLGSRIMRSMRVKRDY